MKRFVQARAGTGAALVFLGVTVMLGWALRSAAMTQIRPDMAGMVFNSALCFALIGLALLLPSLRPSFQPRLAASGQTAIGWALTGISLVVLAGYAVDGSSGLDFPSLHLWLNDRNPHPGRMAIASCIGFALCGLALIYMQRVRRKAHGIIVQAATLSVFAVGLTGVFAYAVDLEALYPSYHAARMPLHTALGMILAAAGLWLGWNRAEWYRSGRYFREDKQVIFPGAAVLVAVAFMAGLASLLAQQHTLEKSTGSSLSALLKGRISLYQDVFRHSLDNAGAIAARPDLLRALRLLRVNPDTHEALEALRDIGNGLISSEVAGIVVHDAGDREIMEFGRFADKSAIATELQGQVRSTLFWSGGLYLNSRLEITDRGETIGFVVVERRLPLLTELLSKTDGLGQTGRVGLCIAEPGHLACFPEYPDAEPYRIARHNAAGQPLAMSYAVEGRSGIFRGLDSRGRSVIAAYGPVHPSGLGMVFKQDTHELYGPVRTQLELTFPVLLVFVALGVGLLRLQVKPLAARLSLSEHDATQAALRARAVTDHVGEGIIVVDAQGVIESFNDAASAMFGYAQAEAIGQNVTLLIPPNMRAWHEEGMRRYLQGEGQHIIGRKNVELTGLRKDGTVFNMEMMLNDVRTGGQRLFVGIVRDITQRKLAEAELREAHAELECRVRQRTAELTKANDLLKLETSERKQAEEALRQTRDILTKTQAHAHLLRKAVAHQDRIKEEERRRIAHEIQGELGGALTGVKSCLSFAVQSAERLGMDANRHILEASHHADSAMETARRVVTDLHPGVPDQLGLWAALEWHAGRLEERTGLQCSVAIDPEAARLDVGPERSIALFRIVQETLTNVVRHAHASNVTILGRCEGDSVVIEVKDDGIGIEPQSLRKRDSWGIEGMHERASHFGGELSISGIVGQSTTVIVRMPMEEANVC